jgi:hypothetical protein
VVVVGHTGGGGNGGGGGAGGVGVDALLAFWASPIPAAAASRAARSRREVDAGRMAANRWLCVLSTAAMESHDCAVRATDLADNLFNTAYSTLSSLLRLMTRDAVRPVPPSPRRRPHPTPWGTTRSPCA